jgi:hypothetical protein
MKLLEDIPKFPAKARRTLKGQYGIDSAEAFYAHAIGNPEGMASILETDRAGVDRLLKTVEGYLPADYPERCRHPVRHPRGLIIDR